MATWSLLEKICWVSGIILVIVENYVASYHMPDCMYIFAHQCSMLEYCTIAMLRARYVLYAKDPGIQTTMVSTPNLQL